LKNSSENDLDPDKIYKFIISAAKITMSSPYSAGAKALLLMFKDAKLLSDDFIIENVKGSKSSKSNSQENSGKKVNQKQMVDDDSYNFSLDSISLSISKDILPDDLEFGKGQLDLFVEHIKKKISPHQEEE